MMAFDEETSETLAHLHGALKALREEIILKNERIHFLEETLMDVERSRSSCSNQSHLRNAPSQSHSSTPHEPPDKGWKSEPILSTPKRHSSRTTTKISLKLKVPAQRLSQSHTKIFQDVKAIQDIMEKRRELDIVLNGKEELEKGAIEEGESSENSDSLDDLLEEAKDFVDIASKQLVTLREWEEIKRKKQRRKTPSPSSKVQKADNPCPCSRGRPFVPSKLSDLSPGSKICAIINGYVRDATVIELLPRFESLVVQGSSKETNTNNQAFPDKYDIRLKNVMLSWH